MEFFTIFLSSLLTLISPPGILVDRVAQKAIRSQFTKVEQLQVRVDAAPSYQLVQGKAERVRIAGRGLFPVPDVRLDVLEVETDPIDVNARRLVQRGRLRLETPLRAGVRLVLKEDDVNRALRSPSVLQQLRKSVSRGLGGAIGEQLARYDFRTIQVDFLGNQRLRVQADLQEANSEPLRLEIESGVELIAGHQIQLVDPRVRVNGTQVPEFVLSALVGSVAQQGDLNRLERSGITARILDWKVTDNQVAVAAFVQVAPK